MASIYWVSISRLRLIILGLDIFWSKDPLDKSAKVDE
jgi:hypothetical protein